MARLAQGGAELEVSSNGGPDIFQIVGSTTRDTTVKRTGNASYKCSGGATNVAAWFTPGPAAPTLAANTSYFFRAYYNFTNLPASTIVVLSVGNASGVSIRVTNGGNVQLWNDSAATQIGSDSAVTIVTGNWYRIEVSVTMNASTQIASCEGRLDGVTIASASGLTIAASSSFAFGWFAGPGANNVVNLDDVAINDSTGGANNTWAGAGALILMTPTSDAQRGVWTNGASGTTNLFDGVNNTPPVGVASGSATATTQIKSSSTGSQTSANDYHGSCGSYTAAGVPAGATINAIQGWCNSGEEVSTGTKAGLVYLQSNPSSAGTTFNFGNDAGAEGTYATNWLWKADVMQNGPTVTQGSALVIGVRRTDSGSRLGDIDFLGAYVDYSPSSVQSLVFDTCRVQRNNLLRR